MSVMFHYELYHHGVKGQKWGVRRYQNSDGTLTSLGKSHKRARSEYRDNYGSVSVKKSHGTSYSISDSGRSGEISSDQLAELKKNSKKSTYELFFGSPDEPVADLIEQAKQFDPHIMEVVDYYINSYMEYYLSDFLDKNH